MTEAQKSFKRKLQNDGLYVDDSTGIPILRDGKGRVIGGGGGGGSVVPSEKQQSKAPMARSLVIDGEPWNMTGIIAEIEMHATGADTFEGVIGIEAIQDIVLRNARLKVNLTTAAGQWTLFASDITILDGQQGDAVFAALIPFPGNRVMVLSIDDSFGVKGVLVGLGGGGGDKEIINVALTKSGSSGNFTGNITAEQKDKLRNMKAVLRATLIATSPTTAVYFEVFAQKTSSKGIQLWAVCSYFGAQVAILWIAEDNSIVLEPITFYSKMEVSNLLNGKQNTITAGTAAPTGGADGDVYIQYEG